MKLNELEIIKQLTNYKNRRTYFYIIIIYFIELLILYNIFIFLF